MVHGENFEKLSSRYAKQKQTAGLVDVKFHLRNTDDAVIEQVCHDVNKLYESVANGGAVKLDFKDSRRG